MVDHFFAYIIPKFRSLTDRVALGYFFLAAFLVRFPFFFRDYIDRDESTFILMGQSWVDGHLPYTELWDVKPPLTFAFFAALIYLFGKSFMAIRLAGTVLVAVTAWYTYKIGETMLPKPWAYGIGMVCVALQSLFGSIQGVMSEHICMAFFMMGLFLFLEHRRWSTMLAVGLLMGIVFMVKLNMAYAILFLGLFSLYRVRAANNRVKGGMGVLLFGLGIIFVVLLTLFPYYQEGLVSLWWKSNFEAPVDYANARRYPIWGLFPYFLAFIGFLGWSWHRKMLDFKKTQIQVLVLVTFGVLFSFVKAGRINSHYLIQLYPSLLLLLGLAMYHRKIIKKPKWWPVYTLLLVLVPAESYMEYANIIQHKSNHGTFYNGEGFSVPKYIQDNGLETDNILFLGYHIGYWVLDKKPPTKAATHPSNLVKEEMFSAYGNPRKTSEEELRYIMETLRPKTVVVRNKRSIFDKKEVEENAYMDAYLAQHYKVVATVEKAAILQRL